MGKRLHIWPEESLEEEGLVISRFTLEDATGKRLIYWYRIPLEFKNYLTGGCEPFVLACLFTAMQTPADLLVHGEVSPILLRNLEEFQRVWSLWCPGLYNRIEILADIENEQPKPPVERALASFSGGVDSSYTVWRHKNGKAGRNTQDVRAGLMIHGYDIPIGRKETFERAASKARTMLNSLNLEMIPLATNLKKLGGDFSHNNSAFLVSCMILFQGGFTYGLISSTDTYAEPAFPIPWGSNPITDPLLSSGVFRIIHDSADVSRNQKIYEIAHWPEAQKYLRVCLGDDRSARDENCCLCEKCKRTILSFRALGFGLPACFKHDVTNRDILFLRFDRRGTIPFYEAILKDAKNARDPGSWVNALRIVILINKIRAVVIDTSIARRLGNLFRHPIH